MNRFVEFGLGGGAGARKCLRQVLMFSLGLVAATALVPIAPAAAQGTTQSEPKSEGATPSESGAKENSDIDALLNEGEQPPSAAEATPTEPAPAVPPAETTPVAQDEPAAPPPEPKKGVQLEEIVVTAQKRAEGLQKVPIAISAFDQKLMEKAGSTSLQQSTTLVPNLQNTEGGFSIRGLGTTSITLSTPTVATHVDGIYVDDDPRGLATNWDISRIEVLRGPQGTLYGRNATAGVVNIITKKPSRDVELFGDVSSRTGNEKAARMVFNQPMSDTFALRLASTYTKGDGWIKDPETGDGAAAAPNTAFGRLSAQWTPLDALTWDVSTEYLYDNTIIQTFQTDYYASKPDRNTAIVYPSGLSPKYIPPQEPEAAQFGSFADRNANRAHSDLLRSSLHYDLNDQWALTWLDGWKQSVSRANFNGFPLVISEHSLRGNSAKQVGLTHSHELDLAFEGTQSHGVIGLYWYRQRTQSASVNHIWLPTGSSDASNPPELDPFADVVFNQLEPSYTDSKAIFSQYTYELPSETRLTGGIRYTRDKLIAGSGINTTCLTFGEFRDYRQQPSPACQSLGTTGALGPVPYLGTSTTFSKVTWKATVDHDFTSSLLGYATVSTGYKQGVLISATVDPVKPETNTNYEVGARWQLFDNRFKFNATAFWMDYVDLQVNSTITVSGVPTTTLTNVGKARSRGVELEYSAQLTANDRIDGYLTFLDAKVIKWPNAPDNLRGPEFDFDAAGHRLGGSPRSTFRLSYAHAFELGSWGKLEPTVSTYRSSDFYAQYLNGPEDYNKSFWRSDLFVRFSTPAERFAIEAFVNNIEDHQYKFSLFSFVNDASDPGIPNPTNPAGPGGGIQWAVYSQPRMWGLRFITRY